MIEGAERAEMRDRVFAPAAVVGQDRHLLAVAVRAPDAGGDGALRRMRAARADRQIFPLDAVIGKLRRQPLVRRIALGDDQ